MFLRQEKEQYPHNTVDAAKATVCTGRSSGKELNYPDFLFHLVDLFFQRSNLGLTSSIQAEGIFRITAENSQEEQVRAQLNSGFVPDDIDVHCLAGLIKVRC